MSDDIIDDMNSFEFDHENESSSEEDTKFDYGLYPLSQRYAADQIPLCVNNRDYTFNQINNSDCHIRGASSDLTKMFGTLHLCLRAEGQQIVPPTVVFRGLSPAKNDCTRPIRNCDWREIQKRADPRVKLLFEKGG